MRSLSRDRLPLRPIIKLVCLLFIVLLVLSNTSTIYGQTTISTTVSSAQLKLRATPSLKAGVITILSRNTVFTIDGRNRAGSWVHGTAASGEIGWVYRSYLKFPRRTTISKLPVLDGNTNPNPQVPVPVTVSFTSQTPYLDQSGKVTLQWNIQGGSFAGLQHRINGSSEWHGLSNLPPTGSATIDLKPTVTAQTGPIYFVDFWLHYANDSYGNAIMQYLRVECPPSMFFRSPSDPMICPLTAPSAVQSAFQPFERGFMIWRGDTKQFYVFTNDSIIQYWGAGLDMPNRPMNPAQIPSGLYQPVSGFGRIWDNAEWLRTSLGWATAPESSYVTTIRESLPDSLFRWPNHTVLTLPSGRAVSFGYNAWSYVE